MFISSAEKEKIASSIKNLEIRIYELEKNLNSHASVKEKPSKPKRPMSPEHRAKIGAGIKAAIAKKREAKASSLAAISA